MIPKLLALVLCIALTNVDRQSELPREPSPVGLAPTDLGVIIDADRTMSAHYRVGDYAVVYRSGEWVTEQVGNVLVSRPICWGAGLLLQAPGGELLWHCMTPQGECVESSEWIAIRPGVLRGAGCVTPWSIDPSGGSASAAATTLCDPYLYDAPRFEVKGMTFSGDCWITTSTGPCDVNKECAAATGTDCTVSGELLGNGSFSEESDCGGGLTVQFYCDGGVNRVRICN